MSPDESLRNRPPRPDGTEWNPGRDPMAGWPTSFLNDESGTVSLDWMVLTAALVGTGLAVLGTVRDGVEHVAVGTGETLRGVVIRASFPEGLCAAGIDAAQDAENRRAADADRPAIDIAAHIAATYADMDGQALASEHQRMVGTVQSDYSRDATILAALECEIAARGME